MPGISRNNTTGVVVPRTTAAYLKSRGKEVAPDLFPEAPGMLPTVHAAGTGERMVMILNFSYRPRSGVAAYPMRPAVQELLPTMKPWVQQQLPLTYPPEPASTQYAPILYDIDQITRMLEMDPEGDGP